jgi:hypothetical protein
VSARAIEASQALGVALFFTPSIVAVIYAYFKGKGNVKDGLSRMLTELSKGYFQPDVGGKNIPVAQGELSDLAGDEPLFKALYQWCAIAAEAAAAAVEAAAAEVGAEAAER